MSEFTRIARLHALLHDGVALAEHGVHVGIGDDAAVLEPDFTVWTIDTQVEGTHFRRELLSFEDIGWRSFMAAASDIAAMGASAKSALSSLILPKNVDDEALDALVTGQAKAARTACAPIVGGNLSRGTEFSVTTTVLGHAKRAILRSSARPGDTLWLAGPAGLAAAGFHALQIPRNAQVHSASIERCVAAWRRPVALLAQGQYLATSAHAAIDISDGLAHDACQIATASGVSMTIDSDALLAHTGEDLRNAARVLDRDAVELALYGGEDYALLATGTEAMPGFSAIGHVEAFNTSRLWVKTGARCVPTSARGFDHFE